MSSRQLAREFRVVRNSSCCSSRLHVLLETRQSCAGKCRGALTAPRCSLFVGFVRVNCEVPQAVPGITRRYQMVNTEGATLLRALDGIQRAACSCDCWFVVSHGFLLFFRSRTFNSCELNSLSCAARSKTL